MESDNIRNKIRSFINGRFPLAKNTNDDHGLLDNGILDSLGILEVVTFLEREFGLAIADEELLPENFESVATLTMFVQNKLTSTQPVQ
jgi:acyl carrier protein